LKSINLLMLLLIWSSFPAKSNAQPDSDSDFQVIDTSRQTYSSYLTLPNLGSNRWPSGTIEWWYNPTGQLLPTALALAAIEKATNTWEGVAGVNFIYMGETSQAQNIPTADRLVIGWLDGNTFESRFGGYSAHTYIWWNGVKIYNGEVSFNAGDTGMQDLDDFQGVMTHELGHVLGLDHSDNSGAIMYSSPYHSGEYQKYLRYDDIQAASTLYPDDCIVTNSTTADASLRLDIPVIRFGDQILEATLNFTGSGLQFSIADYSVIAAATAWPTSCNIDSTLSPELALHLPVVNIGNDKLLADLSYIGDGLFEVQDYQWLTQVDAESPPQEEAKFGSIAYGTSGNWGYSFNYPSQTEANESALAYCGSGCSVIAEAANTCLALATGSGTSYGVGRDNDTASGAATLAVQECNSLSAGSCSVVASFCANQ
jgi:hypothetical protein